LREPDIWVECGLADQAGRRSVIAKWGQLEHRDRLNADDAFCRREFAEAALTRFQRAITPDAVARIDELVIRESAARDSERSGDGLRPCVQRLADVLPSQVDWLWPGRVALGAVTMLAGDPGLGKSLVTLDMAARVSRGASWPDVGPPSRGEQNNERTAPIDSAARLAAPTVPASVVLVCAEDDPSTTIRPRLEALGADCERIRAFNSVEGRDGAGTGTTMRRFDLSRDLAHLTTVVESLGDCRLVVIDPISAFLGRVNENANAGVRSLLWPTWR
jgi:AAA domain